MPFMVFSGIMTLCYMQQASVSTILPWIFSDYYLFMAIKHQWKSGGPNQLSMMLYSKRGSEKGLSQSLINNTISWFLSFIWIIVEIHFYYNSKIIKQSSTGIRYLINFPPSYQKMSLNQSNRRRKNSLRFDYTIIDFYEISGFEITVSFQAFVL